MVAAASKEEDGGGSTVEIYRAWVKVVWRLGLDVAVELVKGKAEVFAKVAGGGLSVAVLLVL